MNEANRTVNDLVFVSGQADCNEQGIVNNVGDFAAQISGTISLLGKRLEDRAVGLVDLVKLVVYYVQPHMDEDALRRNLGSRLGCLVRTAVTFVPLRKLNHAEALLQIEAVAIDAAIPRVHVVVEELADPGVGFCHGISCGEFTFLSGQSSVSRNGSVLFRGDLVSQNQQTIENLQRVLGALSVNASDIVKVNSWRAPAADYTAYAEAANDRFRFFAEAGPAVTGITIPGLQETGHQIRIDLWAIGSDQLRRKINPPEHWGWKIATSYSHGLQVGPWLFVGGQAALTRECAVQHPDNALAQIEVTRVFIENILRETPNDFEVVNVNGMYCASGDSLADHRVVQSLQAQFLESRPAQTVVPVDQLAYPHQLVELDAIARRRT